MSATPGVRPILFSDAMVRAILDGRKTVTRRIVKPQPVPLIPQGMQWKDTLYARPVDLARLDCPYGRVGDRLWVREAWGRSVRGSFLYRASMNPDHPFRPRWRPSIHMPRDASRILLEVTDLRAERLHEITDEECFAEGIRAFEESQAGTVYGVDWPAYGLSPREEFRALWNAINGPGAWDENPWVWVVRFRRIPTREVSARPS